MRLARLFFRMNICTDEDRPLWLADIQGIQVCMKRDIGQEQVQAHSWWRVAPKRMVQQSELVSFNTELREGERESQETDASIDDYDNAGQEDKI